MNEIKPEDWKLLTDKVSDIHNALVGDAYREGLLIEVKKNTAFRETSSKIMGLLTVLGTGIGWLLHKIFG